MPGVVPAIPRLKFTNAAGVPVASGSVTVYLAGTSTLANTYQDKALTILNNNPVPLDGNGEALFWLDPSLTYKFLLKDANNANVSGWPVDNILGGGQAPTLQQSHVDTFSGNGVNKIFTLSAAPAGINDTNVYIAGAYQEKSSYTLSGTTLTFVTAPTLGGSNIEVTYYVLLDFTGLAATIAGYSAAAAASASDAQTSALAASTSETNAAGSVTAINNRIYPGTYTVAPTTRPDGSARQSGDEYFDATANKRYTYNGATWVASDINSANLAAPSGSSLVGDGTTTVADRLASINLADYPAVRAYAGSCKRLRVTGYLVTAAPAGIAGDFVADDTDTTSADNGGTIIVASNGKRWKRVYSGGIDVRWFAAKLDGTTDDSAAFNAAIAALPAAGGTIIVPTGIPTLNITLTKSGVRMVGASKTADRSFSGNYWKPFDVTKPVVQIGNDTGIVSGCTLEQITFYGGTTGQIGLYLAGGSYRNTFHNFSAHDFTLYNVKGLSGANPVAYNYFTDGHINATVVGSRGLFMGVGAGGSYCEANGFANFNIAGPGTSGYAVENDSSGSLMFANVWIQAQNNCGVKFSKSYTTLPKIICSGVIVDSDFSTDALVEGYNTTIVALSDLMFGTVNVDGTLKQSDGTIVSGIRNYGAWMPFQTNFSSPYFIGSVKFLNGTAVASMDPTTYGGSMACASGNWDFTAQLGPMRMASATSSGVLLGSSSTYRWQVSDSSFRPQSDLAYDIGSSSLRVRDVYAKTYRNAVLTVVTLPGAGAAGASARAFVSDSSVVASGNFGAVVAGGGANQVPVYSDGTNWRIG